MTAKNPKPLTRPRKDEPNYNKFCAQPGSLPVTDAPIQPSLAEQLGLKKTMDSPATMVIIHCPVCGWQQEVEESMWKFQSSPVGHGYTCGSGKCRSHTAMVFGPAPRSLSIDEISMAERFPQLPVDATMHDRLMRDEEILNYINGGGS
jgi:hypothetical protein